MSANLLEQNAVGSFPATSQVGDLKPPFVSDSMLTVLLTLFSFSAPALAIAMNLLIGVYGTDYGLVMAGTLCSIAPITHPSLLLQKKFSSGLTSGAVEG